MIILDTNIISELTREKPNQDVFEWFDCQEPQALATTSITVAELWFGLNAMPQGKRQRQLEKSVTEMLDEDLDGNILPFDMAAAEAFGFLAARLKAQGTPVGQSDTMIAAIAFFALSGGGPTPEVPDEVAEVDTEATIEAAVNATATALVAAGQGEVDTEATVAAMFTAAAEDEAAAAAAQPADTPTPAPATHRHPCS